MAHYSLLPSTTPSHNSGRRLRKSLLLPPLSKDASNGTDNLKGPRPDHQRPPTAYVAGNRVPDSRRHSFLDVVRTDIFKRQSLQFPHHNPLDSATTTTTTTNPTTPTKIAPAQADDTNGHPSPNSFAARSARSKVAVASMAPNTTQLTKLQVPECSPIDSDLEYESQQDQASICHSPSWRDDKSAKKQTNWHWKKSGQANPKQEQLNQERSVKQGKKLSKKPPSAMGTQRYSATLANGTAADAPHMERRSSSSGSFTQAMRGFLSRRSSQTTTPEVSRPGSRSQAQPPGHELKAQDLSHKLLAEQSPEHNDTRIRDPTRHGTGEKGFSRKPQESGLAQVVIGPAPLSTPPRSSGKESIGPTPPPKPKLTSPRTASVPASISRMFGKKDNAAGGYSYPASNKKLVNGRNPDAGAKSSTNIWLNQSFNQLRGKSSPGLVENEVQQSSGGYVARERRVNQQRSIARFQDELAVKSAYEQFVVESQLPPTPQDSSESMLETRKEPVRGVPPNQPVSRLGGEQKQASNLPSASSSPQLGPIRKPIPPPKPSENTRWAQEAIDFTSRPLDENVRPGPGVIQPAATYGARSQSLPKVPQQRQQQQPQQQQYQAPASIPPRQITDNALGSALYASKTTNPSVPPPTNHPNYQLPPISASSTSPILSALLEDPHDNRKPPFLSLSEKPLPTRAINSIEKAVAVPAPTIRVLGSKQRTELLIASENAEGLIRKTSVKKSRSDPELKVPDLKADSAPADLPSLDFLPELKHQPLTKPKRPTRVSFGPGTPAAPLSPSQFPIPSPTSEVARRGNTALRTAKWSAISKGSLIGPDSGPPKPIAKMFVICCKCKFWHDLPSKIYEAMALPQAVGREDDIAAGVAQKSKTNASPDASGGTAAGGNGSGVRGLEGKIFTQVKCPWCEHGMSTSCCAGWTAVIYLHERHH